MKDEAPSPEHILEAAMCVWEEIDGKTTAKSAHKSRIWELMTDLREAVGTTTMRYYAGQLAEDASIAFRIAEKAADGFYPYAFDWEFIPELLERALEVSAGCGGFGLVDTWRDEAAAIGRKHRGAPHPKSSSATSALVDREAYLLGVVRCLLMGKKFPECIDEATMAAIINDLGADVYLAELDCTEFREIAPEAFGIRRSHHAKSPFTKQEEATILASLRLRQAVVSGNPVSDAQDEALEDIATMGGEFDALSVADIDRLCERINTGDVCQCEASE